MSIVAVALGGCTMHPQYKRPALDVPGSWANAQGADTTAAPQVAPGNEEWWLDLGDPAIDKLVAKALADNPSVVEALARVDQAHAQVTGSRATQAPRADLDGSLSRSQAGNADFEEGSASITPLRQTGGSLGLALSWEIDLWGRLRQQRVAAERRLDARIADVEFARLSVAAQIADTVIVLRACELSLHIRAIDIASRDRELTIARQRLAFGSIAPADVALAETNLANARTDRFDVQALCQRTRDALVALSGSDTDTIEALLRVDLVPATLNEQDFAALLPVPPEATPTLPATVLLNHPGIIAVERELAARWSEIGVARADRLPRLSLTAALTGQFLSALGTRANYTTWSIGPNMAMPLFDGGARNATVRLASARYRESLSGLNGALRNAARDVEDALADQQSAKSRVATARQAVDAALVAWQANNARWQAGAISAFDLENSRRGLNTAQESAVAAARDRARAWIALVRSTGGAISAGDESSQITKLSSALSDLR